MKWLILISFFSAGFIACDEPQKSAEVVTKIARPQAGGNNSEAFNQSFEKLLSSYYALKNALVDYDTSRANVASKEVALFADSLALDEINKRDSSGTIRETASNYTGTISGSAMGLVGEKDWTAKKKEFQMISDAMYDLARTVQYNGQKIYHQHCPMAFNDQEEAYWLSNSSNIVNPYLGKKHPKYRAAMVECGDVADSLGYK